MSHSRKGIHILAINETKLDNEAGTTHRHYDANRHYDAAKRLDIFLSGSAHDIFAADIFYHK